MGIFGKKPPRTPAQNKAAKAKGDKTRRANDRRAQQIADKQERKKGKKRSPGCSAGGVTCAASTSRHPWGRGVTT